jgi:hypothetical protein
VVYNFQIGKNKVTLLAEYETMAQNVLCDMLYSPQWCLGENMTSFLKMTIVREKAICILWFLETKSDIKMQRRCGTQYGKDPPLDNAIPRWVEQFQKAGGVR